MLLYCLIIKTLSPSAQALTVCLLTVPVQVPENMKIRLKFIMFRVKEPNVDISDCGKDYVEIMSQK